MIDISTTEIQILVGESDKKTPLAVRWVVPESKDSKTTKVFLQFLEGIIKSYTLAETSIYQLRSQLAPILVLQQ